MRFKHIQFDDLKPKRLIWREVAPDLHTALKSKRAEQRAGQTETLQARTEAESLETGFDEAQLSDKGKAWWKQMEEMLKEEKKTVFEESDYFDAELTMRGRAEIVEEHSFQGAMNLRFKNLENRMKAIVWRFDQQLKADLEGASGAEVTEAETQYDDKMQDVMDDTTFRLSGIRQELEAAVNLYGSHEGESAIIDTLGELDLFNRNVVEWLRSTAEGEDVLAESQEVIRRIENGTLNTDVEQLDLNVDDMPLIVKMAQAEALKPADYDEVLSDIQGFFKKNLEMGDLPRTEKALQSVENGGRLMPLHVMTRAQRFELGRRLVEWVSEGKINSEKARDGLLFLSQLGFLTIDQADQLLGTLGGSQAELSKEEIRAIHFSHDQIEEARKLAAEYLKTGKGGSFLKVYGTKTNGLIYAGRYMIALAVALPFLLNIHKPGEWPHIMMDPAWVGAVALGAASADHLSGGLGEGWVSEKIVGVGNRKETVADKRLRLGKQINERLENHRELKRFLTQGGLLKDITEIDLLRDNDAETYRFTFDDLIEYQLENAREDHDSAEGPFDEDATRDALTQKYRKGLDERTPEQTERMIRDLYTIFVRDFGFTDVSEMLNIIE